MTLSHTEAPSIETEIQSKTFPKIPPLHKSEDNPRGGATSCYGDLYADTKVPPRTNSFQSMNSYENENVFTDPIFSIPTNDGTPNRFSSSPMDRVFCLIDCENFDSRFRQRPDSELGLQVCSSCLSKQNHHLLHLPTQ